MVQFLADYFAVINTKEDDIPQVKFRIPEKNISKENPFPEGTELFAMPNGWQLFDNWQPCSFHSVQLTKIDGSPYWASFFNYFYQKEEKYYPTSLVLISSHKHLTQLKNALLLIYESHLTSESNLERLISKILSQPVPYPSRPIIRYKLSTKDYQAILPPKSADIPSTGKSVADLLTWIGPTNLFHLVLLLLTDHKIAIFGRSYSALSESNKGLLALIYPMKYSFPNIPVLPRKMSDMLMSPVPFIVGVHTEIWEERYGDNPDVIGCDLDGSKLIVPDNLKIPEVPELLEKEIIHRLTLVSQPGLVAADLAFPPQKQSPSPPVILDKEIRAIFLSFLVKTLYGYRKALQFTRIHPSIQTRLVEDMFISPNDEKTFKADLSKSQSFAMFIQDRGPSYRPTDLFDQLIDRKPSDDYETDSFELGEEIRQLREEFLINEIPNWSKTRDIEQALPAQTLSLSDAVIKSSDPRSSQGHKLQTEMKLISDASVTVFIEEEKSQNASKLDRMAPDEEIFYRLAIDKKMLPSIPNDTNTKRHLSVMQEYVKFIFNQDDAELKKHFGSVLRAMKSKICRAKFCFEILKWPKNEPMTNGQFDYTARLTDALLTDSTGSSDQFLIARKVIKIGSLIYRKLNKEKQFLYTLVQDHSIWSNEQFWIEHFFHQHQRRLVAHYRRQANASMSDSPEKEKSVHGPEKPEADSDNFLVCSEMMDNTEILECAADQLANWKNKSDNKKVEIGAEEEGIVYANIIDLIYQIVPLLVPFHTNKTNRLRHHMRSNQVTDGNSSVLTGASYNADDDSDEDEGFNESQGGLGLVHKFMEKIQDRLGIECKIQNDKLNGLSQLSTSTIHQFADEYSQINRAFKQLPINRRILSHRPTLLQNERVRIQCLAYLLRDNREYEFTSIVENSEGLLKGRNDLLPAEGTIFITNYRVIFHGISKAYDDRLAIRSLPACSITKFKSLTDGSSNNSNSDISNHQIQIRSASVDFIHFAFGVEVTDDERDQFESIIRELRSSTVSPLDVFAFRQCPATLKYTTFRIKPKSNVKGMTMSSWSKTKIKNPLPTITETNNVRSTLSNKNTLEKVIARTGRNDDLKRLGLINEVSSFRTAKNKHLGLCKTYPSILIQPLVLSDDMLKSISKLCKHNRIPTIVWRSSTGALFARSESFSNTHVLFRKRRNIEDPDIRNPIRDLEMWLQALVQLTPKKQNTASILNRADHHQSNASLASQQMMSSAQVTSSMTLSTSPLRAGATPQKFMRGISDTLRQSAQDINKWSSLQRLKPGHRGSVMSSDYSLTPQVERKVENRARLVVLVEKRHAQRSRVEPESEVELIPVDFTLDGLRENFKNMQKAVSSPIKTELKGVGESNWYQTVGSCLAYASMCAELIQVEQVSVLVALESGWDLTSVLVALTEIILDSNYRTIDGFQTIIEREFLSFGHRFSTNGINELHNAPNPVFILFLDAVSQLIFQNPTSFEFSSFYLETLAYHTYSGRFSTFLLDSDFDRIDSGILFDEKSCLWKYIQSAIETNHVTKESTCIKLLNSTYVQNLRILRVSDLSCHLKLFQIYQIKQISTSNEYDTLLGELKAQNDEQPNKKRKLVYAVYDDLFEIHRSSLEGMTSSQRDNIRSPISESQDCYDLSNSQSVQRIIVRSRALKGDKDASSAIKNYDEPISNKQVEVRSHEGYLYKQANSIYKGWRLSYFVIEDRKTLVQYDDSGSGGEREKSKSIDLTDMTSVFLQPMESLPKGADPRAALHTIHKSNKSDVKLRNRKYSFVARDIPSAEKWVKALSDCIA